MGWIVFETGLHGGICGNGPDNGGYSLISSLHSKLKDLGLEAWGLLTAAC